MVEEMLMLDLFEDSMCPESPPKGPATQCVPESEAEPLGVSMVVSGKRSSDGGDDEPVGKKCKQEAPCTGPLWSQWLHRALLPWIPGRQKQQIRIHSLCSGMSTEKIALEA